MTGRFPLPTLALLGILLLGACGDSPDPVGTQDPEEEQEEEQEEEEEQPVRDYAAATPLGALAGFLDLNNGGPEGALDVFVKIPDIPGESQDADHEDEIDVFGIEWTMSVDIEPGDDGQLAAVARLGEIVLHKGNDLASHELTHVVQQGTVIAEMELSVRRSNAAGHEYLKVQLRDVLVTSIESSGTAGAAPTEEVTFTFQNVTWALPGQEPEAGTAISALPADGLVGFLDLVVPDPDPQPQPMDMYVKIPDIDGESEDAGHQGEIEIDSFSWGTTVHVDAAAGSGRAPLKDLTITKRTDRASGTLADAAAAGTLFTDVLVSFRKDGDAGAPAYYRMTLQRATISSYSPGNSADPVPTETLSLNFEEVGGSD